MTNHIEEMMKTAGVECTMCKFAQYGYEGEQETWYFCTKREKECWTYPSDNSTSCTDREVAFPDFTPEKQLQMIKLLGQSFEVTYSFDFEGDWTFEVENIVKHDQGFTQALAQLINELMNAGELDKSKVKEILEQ